MAEEAEARLKTMGYSNIEVKVGDGYLGWPTAMYLSSKGHEIFVADNMLRRRMHSERSTDSLTPIRGLNQRIEAWQNESGKHIQAFVGDLTDPEFADRIVRETETVLRLTFMWTRSFHVTREGSNRS